MRSGAVASLLCSIVQGLLPGESFHGGKGRSARETTVDSCQCETNLDNGNACCSDPTQSSGFRRVLNPSSAYCVTPQSPYLMTPIRSLPTSSTTCCHDSSGLDTFSTVTVTQAIPESVDKAGDSVDDWLSRFREPAVAERACAGTEAASETPCWNRDGVWDDDSWREILDSDSESTSQARNWNDDKFRHFLVTIVEKLSWCIFNQSERGFAGLPGYGSLKRRPH